MRRAARAIVFLTLVGCGPAPPARHPPPPAPASQPASGPATGAVPAGAALGVDDVFEVRVYGEADLSNTYRVTSDGSINFPLIGKVAVAGRTPAQVAEEIETRLGRDYLQHPQVTIFVREYKSRRFSVYGQVQRPGTFPFEENLTIIEAIAVAGGFTPMAAENEVQISRHEHGRDQSIRAPMVDIREGKAKTIPIKPGDKIFVPERFF